MDYYSILGISKDASDTEIKNAYRQMAKKYHPDRFATKSDAEKKEAEEKFKQINEAYSVLSDPEKKSNYDTYGSADGPSMNGAGGGFWGGNAGGGFDDIFSTIFSSFTGGGRNSRASMAQDGEDVEYTMHLTFEEAAFGTEKEISFTRVEECPDCKGTGARNGTAYKTCSKCGGAGTYTSVQNTPFGQIRNSRVCDACRGSGRVIVDRCTSCNGVGRKRTKRSVNIKVPAGINNGQMMTYYNEGDAGKNGGRKGSLIIIFNVKSHELFRREGDDLYIDIPIKFSEATLGAKIEVPTLTTPVAYSIPEGTQTGTTFRIKGKGVKVLKKEAYGDLYVTVTVETPKGLNRRQRELLETFDKEIVSAGDKQYAKRKAYDDKLKKRSREDKFERS